MCSNLRVGQRSVHRVGQPRAILFNDLIVSVPINDYETIDGVDIYPLFGFNNPLKVASFIIFFFCLRTTCCMT